MFHVTQRFSTRAAGASEASGYCSGDFSMFFLGFKTLGKNCLKEMPKEIIGEAVQSWKYSSNCHPKKCWKFSLKRSDRTSIRSGLSTNGWLVLNAGGNLF